ncbi:MAG: cytochrome c family protein [Planctomycetota bacterium]
MQELRGMFPAARKWLLVLTVATLWLSTGYVSLGWAQPQRCDPSKVISAEACARCHGNEVSRWTQTPHAQTFDQLVRNPKAKEITDRLGLASIKRNDICTQCHFTMQDDGSGKLRAVAGISCESCHGAARDWVSVHNNYGGPTVLKGQETAAHRVSRLAQSTELGMRNTQNIYLIARSCYECHTIPHERLVNVGGHPATSTEFELVAWSQGTVRHNFLRTAGRENAVSSPDKLRLLFVVGLIADLEFSTRATAVATEKSAYGVAVAQRAARAAERLYAAQQKLNDPLLQQALETFAVVELKTNNANQLNAAADRLAQLGQEFAASRDGTALGAIDSDLPPASTYR